MKKLAIVIGALAACLAIASVAIAGGDTTKVKAKVKVSFSVTPGGPPPYGPQASGTFSGRVKVKIAGQRGKLSNKKALRICKKGRKVKVSDQFGKDKTNKKGQFSITSSPPPASGTTYTVTVKRKTVKKKDLTCRKGRKKVTVP